MMAFENSCVPPPRMPTPPPTLTPLSPPRSGTARPRVRSKPLHFNEVPQAPIPPRLVRLLSDEKLVFVPQPTKPAPIPVALPLWIDESEFTPATPSLYPVEQHQHKPSKSMSKRKSISSLCRRSPPSMAHPLPSPPITPPSTPPKLDLPPLLPPSRKRSMRFLSSPSTPADVLRGIRRDAVIAFERPALGLSIR